MIKAKVIFTLSTIKDVEVEISAIPPVGTTLNFSVINTLGTDGTATSTISWEVDRVDHNIGRNNVEDSILIHVSPAV